MNNIILDEAVNGFMVTILWGEDKIIKEVCETRAEAYGIIARWLGYKMDDEAEILRRAAGEVL